MYRAGALSTLAQTLSEYKCDITTIQKIRWVGQGVLQKRNYDFYYSCGPREHKLGVGFLIDGKIRNRVINFNLVSSRLCCLRIKTAFFNISIINAHAPTEDKNKEDKDNFYEDL